MNSPPQLPDPIFQDAWTALSAEDYEERQKRPNANRLAFADTEFMLRRETRGIRCQLELLKPDLAQQAQGIENTVVVFGSARFVDSQQAQEALSRAQASGDVQEMAKAQRLMRNAGYYEQAREFGKLVATYSDSRPPAERLTVCTGGGPGIMEAANRGAHEAGAQTVGLNITLPHEQRPNLYVTPSLSFKFHYFALRKMHFMMRAKALVAFPGGFGTLDELFEVITLVQTKKSKGVPIILFGTQYWKRLVDMDLMVEEGVVSPEDLQLIDYADEPEQAWRLIRDYYEL
jgi:uncharacterized protein (TIGR00730 family)